MIFMHSPLLFLISDQQVEGMLALKLIKTQELIQKLNMNYLSTDHDRMIAAKGLKLTKKNYNGV